MKHVTNDNGFTLIEAMISMLILIFGVLAYLAMQAAAISGNQTGASITGKANWAADQIEQLIAMPYDDLAALDIDGDGTDQDPLGIGKDKDDNGDSVIDANENFGLHHDTATTADGTVTSPDSTYTIFWNVAVDKPLEDMVTVHVLVESRKQTDIKKTVEFEYIKARTY